MDDAGNFKNTFKSEQKKTQLFSNFQLRSFLSLSAQPLMLKHLLNKHPIPFRRVRYKHMRHGPDDFSILQDRAAAHECVKERTTNFDKLFQFLAG